jgi:DNA-binding SARP family transcriptional activator
MTARNDGEVQGLREHRAERCWLAVFVLVTAVLVPSGQALAVDQAMEPNSILVAESFVGAQMTTPEDGRLRGYGFAATVTSAGTAEGATRLLSTFRPAEEQRLVAFALRFDLLRDDNDTSHPVRATLVVDGRRSALDDGDFVRSGERMYAASVPSEAKEVDLEMSAAGLAQAFSLTEGHRVGDQPVVLYRDPTGPEVVSDVNDERTLSATSAADGAKGAVTIALKRARLSYFSPGEPMTTAGSPSRAFLIVEGTGDGVQPPSGTADYGRYFSNFAALPGRSVQARLPDDSVVEGRHAGSEEGLLGGWYYFSVPADLASARITVEPGPVAGSQYRGFVGQPANIRIDGAASFDVSFGAHAAASTSPVTIGPTPPERQLDKTISQEDDSWPFAAILAALTAAVLVAGLVGVRQKRRSGRVPGLRRPTFHSAERGHVHVPACAAAAEPERLLDIAGTEVALEGPGVAGAARAAIIDALVRDGGPPVVVVLVSGPTRNLVPAGTNHRTLRLVRHEEELLRELEIVTLQHRRLALETEEAGGLAPNGRAVMLVVAPCPLGPKVRLRLDALNAAVPGRNGAEVICLGRDNDPLLVVDESGGISTSGEHTALRRVRMMTEAEAAAALANLLVSPPTPLEPAVEEPVEGAKARPRQNSAEMISVRLLGPYRITVGDSEVASGLRAKARELLAYLAVNREGVTMDAATEALWPEADPDKGQSYFRTVIANLRSTLRAAAGLEDACAVVERVGPRYRLDPDLVVVDLWQFSDGLRGINREADAAGREHAADSYVGEFAAGEDFTWAGPVREQLRRKAIDNLTALAEARRASDDLKGALRALERAIEFDPYGEELYSAAMKIQLLLGRRDAAGRTLRLLEQRLAEIGSRPQEGTRRLLSQDSRT